MRDRRNCMQVARRRPQSARGMHQYRSRLGGWDPAALRQPRKQAFRRKSRAPRRLPPAPWRAALGPRGRALGTGSVPYPTKGHPTPPPACAPRWRRRRAWAWTWRSTWRRSGRTWPTRCSSGRAAPASPRSPSCRTCSRRARACSADRAGTRPAALLPEHAPTRPTGVACVGAAPSDDPCLRSCCQRPACACCARQPEAGTAPSRRRLWLLE